MNSCMHDYICHGNFNSSHYNKLTNTAVKALCHIKVVHDWNYGLNTYPYGYGLYIDYLTDH